MGKKGNASATRKGRCCKKRERKKPGKSKEIKGGIGSTTCGVVINAWDPIIVNQKGKKVVQRKGIIRRKGKGNTEEKDLLRGGEERAVLLSACLSKGEIRRKWGGKKEKKNAQRAVGRRK